MMKKKKFKIILIVCILLSFIVLGLVIMFNVKANNTFIISQIQNVFELGTDYNLVNCLNYDKDNIIGVSAIDDEHFDINTPGNYDVMFAAMNNRKKIKKIIYTFQVVDTIPPEIATDQDVIYVIQNTEFKLEDIFQVKDKSSNCFLSYTGTYDVTKEGIYDIKVYASDESGNNSPSIDLKIIVENRDNCDFRNAKFGDNKETVIRYEDLDLSMDVDTYLEYETVLDNENAYLYYNFNSKDELYLVEYYFTDKHTNKSYYIESFQSITGKLTQKYGSPSEVISKKGNLYAYCVDDAQALSVSQITYETIWKLDNMNIKLELFNDNYNITYRLSYQSEKIEPENKDLNML